MKSEKYLIDLIHERVKSLGSQSAAAKTLGVSRQYIGRVLSGEMPIADSIARELGFKPVRMFQPITEGK